MRQDAYGKDPDIAAFELALDYDAVKRIGTLRLLCDADPTGESDEEAEAQECERATNGNCRLVWNTSYSRPGRHFLQAWLLADAGRVARTTQASAARTIRSTQTGRSLSLIRLAQRAQIRHKGRRALREPFVKSARSMGIEVHYRRLPKEEFDRIRRDPIEREKFTLPNLPGFDLKSLMELSSNPQAMAAKRHEILAAFKRGREDPTRADLDKDWHALHFLLTGDSSMDIEHRPEDPLRNVVMGGHETELVTGYGPARVFELEDVRSIADALAKISVDDLRSRFSAKAFNAEEIYPNPRPGGWSEQEIQGVFDLFPLLVRFFQEAVKAGEVVVIYAT